MGCAGSTPVVAAAKDEMTKATVGLPANITDQAETVVKGATETLIKTIDDAKDNVTGALMGLTNSLGDAVKGSVENIDGTNKQTLKKLHFDDDETTEISKTTSSTEGEDSKTLQVLAASGKSQNDEERDSLKTSTPEPEIEEALANHSNENNESPPTPQPNLCELEKLTNNNVDETGIIDGNEIVTMN